MADALFRVELPNRSVRIARGDSYSGPKEVLDSDLTLTQLIVSGRHAVLDAVENGPATRLDSEVRILAPIEDQPVWAAGVTYGISRDARRDESAEPDVYERVWDADRPELFFKSSGGVVKGPETTIGIRADSDWNVPEPELVLVLAPDMTIVGYAIGNDVSSRSIEGENPLYLPQAKVYDSSCALGPCIVPHGLIDAPFTIDLRVCRNDVPLVALSGSTAEMKRGFDELAGFLGRANSFPLGALLMTGTSLVPDSEFGLARDDRVTIKISGLGQLSNTVTVVGTGAPAVDAA